jgi:phage gp46-like protein
MMDILISYNNETGTGDFAIANGALAMDDTLDTAVLFSLFTDRQADPGDALPPGTTDRRGWSGDTAFQQSQTDSTPDLIGSKLWLRVNGLLTQATLNQMGQDVLQALQWMLEDGVAQSVTCVPAQTGIGSAALPIVITQMVNGQPVTTTYDAIWNTTMGLTTFTRRSSS